MNDYKTAVGRLAAQLPQCWKTDHRINVAKQIVTSNAQHEVNNNINQFALDAAAPRPRVGDQTMPTTTYASAAMPPSRNDQNGNFVYNNRGNNRPSMNEQARALMRNGYADNDLPPNGNNQGAADQITPEHIADWVGMAYHKFSPNEQDELCAHLQDLIDTHNGNSDQAGAASRLPHGQGSNVTNLTNGQGISGSFAENDLLWNPDNPYTPGLGPSSADRRTASDRGFWPPNQGGINPRNGKRSMAKDAALRAARHEPQDGGFLSRFPEAAHITFSGTGR